MSYLNDLLRWSGFYLQDFLNEVLDFKKDVINHQAFIGNDLLEVGSTYPKSDYTIFG